MKNLETIIDDVCKGSANLLLGDDSGEAFDALYCGVLDLCARIIDDDTCTVDGISRKFILRGISIDGVIEGFITGTYPCIDEQGDLGYLNYDLCEPFLECLDCTLRGYVAYKDILSRIESRFYDFFGTDIEPDEQPSYAYDNSVGFIKMILECIDDANKALKKYGLKELDRRCVLMQSMHTARLTSDSDYYRVVFNIKVA